MAIKLSAVRPSVVLPPPSSVTLELDLSDATVLRLMLGGLKRAERCAATKANGGTQEQASRARYLVKEIIDALSAEGIVPPPTPSVQPEAEPETEEDVDY